MEGDERALWDRWRSSRDMAARDALIAKYSPWSRMVARDVYVRVHALTSAWPDCAQNALVGLLEAINRFEPARGILFQTFARHRIRGAVFDGMRALRDDFRPEGQDNERVAMLRERVTTLVEESAPDPLEAFVTSTVGLGLGFLMELGSVPAPPHVVDAYTCREHEELSEALADAVEHLPERERAIMVLHYHHHVPFVAIAEQFGVTKGRVSQLHKRALERLRDYLRDRVLVGL